MKNDDFEHLRRNFSCVLRTWRSLTKLSANGTSLMLKAKPSDVWRAKRTALIRGKHKPQFTPHVDTGDFVVIINAEKIVLTGKKMQGKKYYRHSMHPGGLKVTTAEEMVKNKPERMLELAVRGMLPKTRMGEKMKLRLKAYRGTEHPHAAQKPEVYELRG